MLASATSAIASSVAGSITGRVPAGPGDPRPPISSPVGGAMPVIVARLPVTSLLQLPPPVSSGQAAHILDPTRPGLPGQTVAGRVAAGPLPARPRCARGERP